MVTCRRRRRSVVVVADIALHAATTFRLELGASKRVKCNFVNVIIDWWRWEMQVHSTGDRSACALHRTLLLHIYWLCITFRCHNDNKFNNSASWSGGVLYNVQHQQQWNWIRLPCRTHNFGRRRTHTWPTNIGTDQKQSSLIPYSNVRSSAWPIQWSKAEHANTIIASHIVHMLIAHIGTTETLLH